MSRLVGLRPSGGTNGHGDLKALSDPSTGGHFHLDGQLDRLLDLLPEDASAGSKLRDFWANFAALDFRPLLCGRRWVRGDLAVLEQVRKRCITATYPFALALSLLLEGPHW